MSSASRTKRDKAFPPYARDYFYQILEQYDLLIEATGGSRSSVVDALIRRLSGAAGNFLPGAMASNRDAEPQISWSDVFMVETAYYYAVPTWRVAQELGRMRNRFRDVVGDGDYALYLKTVEPDITKLSPDQQRAELMTLLERVQYEYTFIPPKEYIRNRISMEASFWTLGAVVAAIVVYASFEGAHVAVPTFIAVMFAGIVGGFLSCQQRLQSTEDIDPLLKELQLSSGWFSVVILAPLSGGIFGVVIYMIFVAGLLSGGLFPTFGEIAPQESHIVASAAPRGPAPSPLPSPAGITFGEFVQKSAPQKAEDFGKLLVWAFIAGFAERFVPDVLTRLAGQPFSIGGSRPPVPQMPTTTTAAAPGKGKNDEEPGDDAEVKGGGTGTAAPTVAHAAPPLPQAPHAVASQLAHIVVDRAAKRCKMFLRHADGTVELKHDVEAHTDAVGSANGDPYGPDGLAPPGDYGLGAPQPCATRNADGSVTINNNTPPDWDRAFGCWFTPLTDTHGLEGSHGRSGIGFHGGGSNAPDPFAAKQGWYATCGCIRLQNGDNENVFVPFVKDMQKTGVPIVVTIVQDTVPTVSAAASRPRTEPAGSPVSASPGGYKIDGADGQSYAWGVDSATSLLDNAAGTNQNVVPFLLSKTGHSPAFWGRYLANYAIGEQELARIADLRIPIVPIYNGTGLRPAKTLQDGRDHAAQAIAKARVLGIPTSGTAHPVCIYADVEEKIAYVTADWYRGWCATLLAAGYRPGVYGKANDPGFAAPYSEAFAADENVRAMYYWASHDNFSITPARETLAEVTPPFASADFPVLPAFLTTAEHRAQFVMWQFLEDAYGGTYDYDLALQPALDAMWRP
jgi:membrane associated rhomboid family serine protease